MLKCCQVYYFIVLTIWRSVYAESFCSLILNKYNLRSEAMYVNVKLSKSFLKSCFYYFLIFPFSCDCLPFYTDFWPKSFLPSNAELIYNTEQHSSNRACYLTQKDWGQCCGTTDWDTASKTGMPDEHQIKSWLHCSFRSSSCQCAWESSGRCPGASVPATRLSPCYPQFQASGFDLSQPLQLRPFEK